MGFWRKLFCRDNPTLSKEEREHLNKLAQLVRDAISGENWSFDSNVVNPILSIASKDFPTLPKVKVDFTQSNIISGHTIHPENEHETHSVVVSEGLVAFISEMVLAVALSLAYKGTPDNPILPEITAWLAPRIDKFAVQAATPRGIPLEWILALNDPQLLSEATHIAHAFFNGALRFLVAHEIGHIIPADDTRKKEVFSFAEELAQTMSPQSMPSWADKCDDAVTISWTEELVADHIGTQLAIKAWTNTELKHITDDLENVFDGEEILSSLGLYYAGMELFPSFLETVERRMYAKKRIVLRNTHPYAWMRIEEMRCALQPGIDLGFHDQDDRKVMFGVYDATRHAEVIFGLFKIIGSAVTP